MAFNVRRLLSLATTTALGSSSRAGEKTLLRSSLYHTSRLRSKLLLHQNGASTTPNGLESTNSPAASLNMVATWQRRNDHRPRALKET